MVESLIAGALAGVLAGSLLGATIKGIDKAAQEHQYPDHVYVFRKDTNDNGTP